MSKPKFNSQEVIQAIIDSKAILFHDQYKEPYIAPEGDGSRIIRLSTKEFKHWLSAFCFKEFGTALSTVTTGNVVQALCGNAIYRNEMIPLNVRYVLKDGVYWYDLGNTAVRVDKNGWSIEKQPPILFRRYSHQMPQVRPIKGGSLNLKHFVNIDKDNELMIFTVFTVSAFLPDFPHPLLVLSGPQGAGKSTPMRLLKDLIDPSVIKGVPAPNDGAAFAQFAFHHAFMFFDNLSGMKPWFSDALARASTGDGFSKRALFSDDDDVIYIIQRPIAINGISQVINKADLLDRAILIGLKRIDPNLRLSEDEFWTTFYDHRAQLLGAIFTLISKALKIIESVELDWHPRMADFARWGYAIAEVAGLGGDNFVEAYKANIEKQDEEAIEANPAAQALISYMEDREDWEGTASELLKDLNTYVGFGSGLRDSYLWPKDAARLSIKLNEVEPNLMSRGLFLKRYTSNLRRITKVINENKIKANKEAEAERSESEKAENSKSAKTVKTEVELLIDEVFSS
jgi:hypothetical protein